jgi:hypothetical protein
VLDDPGGLQFFQMILDTVRADVKLGGQVFAFTSGLFFIAFAIALLKS